MKNINLSFNYSVVAIRKPMTAQEIFSETNSCNWKDGLSWHPASEV